MPKQAIKDLSKIEVRYSYQRFKDEQWATGQLELCFANEASAIAFFRNLSECNREHFGDERVIFVPLYPLKCYAHYSVKLYLGAYETNRNMTAAHILAYLTNYFELPNQLEISYPGKAFNDPDRSLILPTAKGSYIDLPLDQFLTKLALEQQELQTNLSLLIDQKKVLVDIIPMQAKGNGLKITCETEQDAKLLKKKLYNNAVDNNAESQFRIRELRGVAGVTHPNAFRIALKPYSDFDSMWKLLVKITAPVTDAKCNSQEHLSMQN